MSIVKSTCTLPHVKLYKKLLLAQLTELIDGNSHSMETYRQCSNANIIRSERAGSVAKVGNVRLYWDSPGRCAGMCNSVSSLTNLCHWPLHRTCVEKAAKIYDTLLGIYVLILLKVAYSTLLLHKHVIDKLLSTLYMLQFGEVEVRRAKTMNT